MKKVTTQLLIITFIFMFAACSSNKEVANEFVDYYNEEWIPIVAMKSEKMEEPLRKIGDIQTTQSNYEEEAVDIIESDFIPIVDEVIARLESIDLKHREVIKANDLQIEAEKHARTIFENGADYYNGDYTDMDVEKSEIELKEKYDAVLEYHEELIEKYDLEYDKEQGKVDGFFKLKYKEK